ncbi:MAG TPA: reverse transcriptase family protein [Anaerovoracaceae bacterium]|nr:reverse transcriptase family protein [Anaerovoracaceae bacterium]
MICTLREFLESLEPVDTYRLFRYTDEALKEKRCYTQIPLRKKNGGVRILQAPNNRLKRLQRALLPYFQYAEISSCAAAYVKGRTLLDHALQHTGSRMIVKLDIENFFGSITFPKVFRAVDEALRRSPLAGPDGRSGAREDRKAKHYNSEMSWFIAKACTLNGALPQGAPTSPALSNMVFFPLDKIIASYCRKHEIRYTRYSDDMIFSGDFRPSALIALIRKLLARNGYVLNEDKIVIAGSGRQQKITGVVVNQRPQADRKYRREIRQDIHYIGKYGLEEHLRRKGVLADAPDGADKTVQLVKELKGLIGRISFVLQIDPGNKEFQIYKELSINLLNRVPRIWTS